MSRFASESELALVVRDYWRDLGFETFPEVAGGVTCARPDIVAVRGPLVVWVETKLSWSLDLLRQGLDARRYAHRVYVAAPAPSSLRRSPWVFQEAARSFGIGVLEVTPAPDGAREKVPAAWNRDPYGIDKLRAACAPETRCVEPGQAGGGYYTPFKGTMRAVREYVTEHPGATTREVVDGVAHHYASDSSARSCLPSYASNGVLAKHGIRIDRTAKPWRWYAGVTR